MRELWRKLRFLFDRGQFDRDLDEEMRHHLAMKAEEQGSAAAANRRFGNVTLLKEDSRAMWTWTFWEQAAQDVRYGLRTMAANPLFTVLAALSLALGIGANTAIYSFMDAILMRSLPVQNPQELVVIKWRASGHPDVIHGMHGSQYGNKKTGVISPNYPFAAYGMLGSNRETLSSLCAYAHADNLNLITRGQAEIANGELVSGSYYGVLGVLPAAGRLVGESDDRAGAAPVAVISYRYWRRHYASDPAVVGQSIQINRVSFTIIGVSAPEFFGVDPGQEPSVYLPLHAATILDRTTGRADMQRFLDNNFYWVEMMGRLRSGIGFEQAQTALAGQFRQWVLSTASTAKEKTNLPTLWIDSGAGGLDSLRRQYSEPLYVLMAMVGLILLIASANIASLLLARATARRREMAVRLSLGAGRLRVVRQLLTESVMLSLLGGVLGLIVAAWGIRSITWLLANGQENFTLNARLNWPVLGFTLALAFVTGIAFGLVPAIQATKVDLTPALKETRASAPRGRARRIGVSQILVVSQLAMSLMLVVAAGLFVRTLSNLNAVNLGFNRENILLFKLDARSGGYKDAAAARFYGDLLDRFRRIPGVLSAGLSGVPLVSNYWNETGLTIPGAPVPSGTKLSTSIMTIDPGFLGTMQIPILMGRGFEDRDVTSPRVAVVTEKFARKFFDNQNPIGRRIGLELDKPADIEIIGVAKTTLYNSVKEDDTPPVVYVPYTQFADRRAYFELRSAGDPMALVNSVRQIVHQASASVPMSEVTTQAARIDQTISRERTFAELCTCFAILALVTAGVGLYGTIAYAVARRTNEIGIRMALGAERRRIVWMVLSEVLMLGFAGLAIGLGMAWGSTRFVESFLFGLKHNDPLVLSLSVVLLAAAATVAGYAPAWRASRIDPMVALRHE